MASSSTAIAYSQARFMATHNSYSGSAGGGDRGTYTRQLDSGIRFLELDIDADDFTTLGDYQVGHGMPGYQVDHSPGNPSSNNMCDWLDLVASWSRANPGHAPITMALDLKSDLGRRPSVREGNLAALNALVSRSFGDLLLTSEQLGQGAWPTVDELRGKVVVVMSGSESSREAYRSDQGAVPSVAVNDNGWVVEVHQSQSSQTLWYWTGRLAADGTVAWIAHAKYDNGITPAVAVDTDGVVVEVHQSQHNAGLWYRVGQIEPDGQISFGSSQSFASGDEPSVAFDGSGSSQVSEIHVSGGTNQLMTGTVDAAARTISWTGPEPTTEPRYPTSTASSSQGSVSVTTGIDSAGVSDTLLYSTGSVSQARITYRQVLFVEYQKGDSSRLANDGLWFYAASASNLDWGGSMQAAGKIVRLWGFDDESDTSVTPPVSFPATDTPYVSWYQQYAAEIGAVT
jgi:hypothetical protein